MKLHLEPAEESELLDSIQRFLSEELELDASELQARMLLGYIAGEIAPFAYNQGVADAKRHFQQANEELDGTCFEQGLTYWDSSGRHGKHVRRKP
ncbi:DUF2164 domain-containing protein [Luteolibacter marinus]|uniref:DUF2164 domain-containing protein n=1 Tax=Luteolibacter marinus TaxID=2776705 RepID=UPI0018693B4D|nr:DUF2164 domain-containing protein [Luteolibacter marinus]